MSSEYHVSVTGQEREKLLPVVGVLCGLYVTIMTMGYFVGNLIHQIP